MTIHVHERRNGAPDCPLCARDAATNRPSGLLIALTRRSAPAPVTPAPVAVAAPVAISPAAPRRRSAVAAALLNVVPGIGHAYAGAWGRGSLLFLLGMPTLAILAAAEAIAPATGLVFLGLLAADAYRLARARNGDWTARRTKDARSALLAFGLAWVGVHAARAAGVPAHAGLVAPVFMILFGIALACPSRERVSEGGPPADTPGAAPAPGQTIDRRVSREQLSNELVAAGKGEV